MNFRQFVKDAFYSTLPMVANLIFVFCVLLAYYGEGANIFAGWMFGAMILCIIIPFGTWQLIPSVFWRYTKERETRVILRDSRYYPQVKIWGIWFDFVCHAKNDEIHLAWLSKLTVYEVAHKQSGKAHQEIDELATYILNAQTPGAGKEVISRKKIVSGRVE